MEQLYQLPESHCSTCSSRADLCAPGKQLLNNVSCFTGAAVSAFSEPLLHVLRHRCSLHSAEAAALLCSSGAAVFKSCSVCTGKQLLDLSAPVEQLHVLTGRPALLYVLPAELLYVLSLSIMLHWRLELLCAPGVWVEQKEGAAPSVPVELLSAL